MLKEAKEINIQIEVSIYMALLHDESIKINDVVSFRDRIW